MVHFSAMALGFSLMVAVPALAQSPATPATGATARKEMSIVQIHDKLIALGYVNIRGIELERGVFEAKASDKNGARGKLYLDAITGEVVNNRRDGRHHESREHHGGYESGRSSSTHGETRSRDERSHRDGR